MENQAFQELIQKTCQTDDLPQALALLRSCGDENIAEAANQLTGKFNMAEVDGKQKIYHIFTELNEENEEQEFAEFVMNIGDDIMLFVAWFFYTQFEIKASDVYAAAGKTYKQPKKSCPL